MTQKQEKKLWVQSETLRVCMQGGFNFTFRNFYLPPQTSCHWQSFEHNLASNILPPVSLV